MEIGGGGINLTEKEIKLPKLRCLRCNHEWHPRKEEMPKTCPNCKSPYWDRERRKNDKNVKGGKE